MFKINLIITNISCFTFQVFGAIFSASILFMENFLVL